MLVSGECAFRLLVMWCVVNASRPSEIGAGMYSTLRLLRGRGRDTVAVLSDIGIVWSVRVVFGIKIWNLVRVTLVLALDRSAMSTYYLCSRLRLSGSYAGPAIT